MFKNDNYFLLVSFQMFAIAKNCKNIFSEDEEGSQPPPPPPPMTFGSYFPAQKKTVFDPARSTAPNLALVPGNR